MRPFLLAECFCKKGASITNIVIILSAWAVVKVPMLVNEAKFLTVSFMATRWVLTVIAIMVMAYLVPIVVQRKDLIDKDAKERPTMRFMIREEYCIGCGLCVKLQPEYYEMEGSKAQIKKLPRRDEARETAQESVNQCPTRAIELKIL